MKDDSNRSLRRVNRKSRSAADRTVEVDSSAFFAEDPSPTPPPRKKPGSSAPRRSGAPAQAAAAAPSKFGRILLPVQGILSVASLVQLWRSGLRWTASRSSHRCDPGRGSPQSGQHRP